ncbi:MAG TPA: DUF885 domain-containing protein [Gemmatimonadaceae bacterium]|nr:DUF885 domain-containing protein [Gemmatimonadaceae bacterium]
MSRSRLRSLAAGLFLAATLAPAAPSQRPLPGGASTAANLRALAHEYYAWRDSVYPVTTSDQGNHRWDDRLTDYRMPSVRERRVHVREVLARVRAMNTKNWSTDDRVDWMLFRSDLVRDDFFSAGNAAEESNPQVYTGEAANGVFSLLKKDYAPRRTRALAATARLEQVPAMLATARTNLARPVKLYAQLAIASARGGDDLYITSLMTLADSLSPAERAALVRARDGAVRALHDFADWMQQRLATMPDWRPMGVAKYEYLLHDMLLLPLSADQVAMIGEVELGRYRGLESLLADPTLASPDPRRAKRIPNDQAEFLAAYESRLREIVDFLRANRLVTLPPYLGDFRIRQLPEAFKPTSPGGFMNPPGIYDSDPTGFYFIPTYNPASGNFYIRAAIEDPRPILGHEGIPGHFLQLSIANHLTNEIRRQHADNTFTEGWALYGEEMLLRQGLYPAQSAGEGQVLRLSRYRAARIGVDVNLQTGRWTFEQAVKYFMEAGGLDREAAEGEAAGAAASPTQKIGYMVGKWQIMRLLGRYRDRQGAAFRLGEFHDRLLRYGSLPVSVIEQLMLGDDAGLSPGPRKGTAGRLR